IALRHRRPLGRFLPHGADEIGAPVWRDLGDEVLRAADRPVGLGHLHLRWIAGTDVWLRVGKGARAARVPRPEAWALPGLGLAAGERCGAACPFSHAACMRLS